MGHSAEFETRARNFSSEFGVFRFKKTPNSVFLVPNSVFFVLQKNTQIQKIRNSSVGPASLRGGEGGLLVRVAVVSKGLRDRVPAVNVVRGARPQPRRLGASVQTHPIGGVCRGPCYS